MTPLLRHVAFSLVVIALAALGGRAWRAAVATPSLANEAILWTSGPAAIPSTTSRLLPQRALPDANDAPADVQRIPDLGYLRREFPHLQRVHVLGSGVTAAEAAYLDGLDVLWNTPPGMPHRMPAVIALSHPSRLAIGQRMPVQGRLRGPPSATLSVSLENPDGTTATTEARFDAEGEATFALLGAAAPAAGDLEWKLRYDKASPPAVLGITVAAPLLPRILILQASPSTEAARLQRWLATSGAAVASRTRVSAEHWRTVASPGAPEELPTLDAAALARFDLLIATDAAVALLTGAEQRALEEALRTRGLGLLLWDEPQTAKLPESLALDTRELPATAAAATPSPATGSGDNDPSVRLVRLRLVGGQEIEEPVTTLLREFTPAALARTALRDTRDRSLVLVANRGRGILARSLVVDTWKWLQNGHAESYARFWSALLGEIAAPAATGRWELEAEEPSALLFARAPLRVAWIAPEPSADAPLARSPTTYVSARGNLKSAPISLHFAADPGDPRRYVSTFWAPQAGWYEVSAAETTDAPSLSFYVQAADALPDLRNEARRDVTARLAATKPARAPAESPGSTAPARMPALADWLLFAVVVAAGLVLYRTPVARSE